MTKRRAFNELNEVLKTRKPHECVWCKSAITIGEPCLNYVGHWEGDFQNWYVHHSCKKSMSQSAWYQEEGAICQEVHFNGEECSH